MVNLEGLDSKNIFELRLIAKELGIQSATKYKKSELIDRIIKVNSKVIQNELPAKVVSESTPKKETEHEEKVFETAGQLEIMHSGYGFLRCKSADGSNEDILHKNFVMYRDESIAPHNLFLPLWRKSTVPYLQ